MTFIKKHINLSYSFDGSIKRIETWQYPLPALREILLNAIVHRDYKNSTDIIIKIFDNKIRFSNPGNLYGELTLEDLNHNSYVPSHRNKLLVEMFYLLGEIEKYGTGYVRIKEQLKEHGNLSIEIKEQGQYFVVDVVPEANLLENTNESDHLKQKTSEKILSLIANDHEITIAELAEKIAVTTRTIERNLKKLQASNRIKRVGSDRSGHWEIL
ncbi:MAG: HTH domain-containing protein [Gammaproteobacteria bacterium]|mgnify:CR=1 FL=1|nr:MAG: HTH domain-containing protein [Gammaproteobacteria bacterium]